MTLIVDWRETNPKWPKTRQWCFCVTGVMIDHSGKAQTFTVPCYSLYWVGWGQGRERERDAVNTYYYPPQPEREGARKDFESARRPICSSALVSLLNSAVSYLISSPCSPPPTWSYQSYGQESSNLLPQLKIPMSYASDESIIPCFCMILVYKSHQPNTDLAFRPMLCIPSKMILF